MHRHTGIAEFGPAMACTSITTVIWQAKILMYIIIITTRCSTSIISTIYFITNKCTMTKRCLTVTGMSEDIILNVIPADLYFTTHVHCLDYFHIITVGFTVNTWQWWNRSRFIYTNSYRSFPYKSVGNFPHKLGLTDNKFPGRLLNPYGCCFFTVIFTPH
jgi:hypothetical protein